MSEAGPEATFHPDASAASPAAAVPLEVARITQGDAVAAADAVQENDAVAQDIVAKGDREAPVYGERNTDNVSEETPQSNGNGNGTGNGYSEEESPDESHDEANGSHVDVEGDDDDTEEQTENGVEKMEAERSSAEGDKASTNGNLGSAVSSAAASTSNSTTTSSSSSSGESSEDEEEEEGESEAEEEDGDGSEQLPRKRLRRRKVNEDEQAAKQERLVIARITKLLKKEKDQWTDAEKDLVDSNPKLVEEVLKRISRRKRTEDRKKEVEDPPDVLYKKCVQLAKAIERSKNLVVYTGAGVSTAANIPDYRGPKGVWTLLDKGVEVPACNLEQAEPTFTHMALFTLYRKGKLKHVVSQNCDGLHLRSGIPRYALSEVHGNMFIEICKHCRPMRPFVRQFDVTERTNKGRHTTNRRCYVCGNSLFDTIVHFGERGTLKWPINWQGATKAADKADVILCLGSSLQVLRRYPWLWCMDRPPRQRPKLFIVNLQWTPKDSAAKVKLNGKCDDVMRHVMAMLERKVPDYYQPNDPIFTYATQLNSHEEHTSTRTSLVVRREEEDVAKEGNGNGLSGETAKEAVSKDHPYASPERNSSSSPAAPSACKRPRRSQQAMRGRFVEGADVDYKSMRWPRDALYLPYQPFFEYIDEDNENVGTDVFCCDCCDPAMKKKRRRRSQSESDSEDEDDDEDEEEEEEEAEDGVKTEIKKEEGAEENDDANVKSEPADGVKTEAKEEDATPDASDVESTAGAKDASAKYPVNQPGWFGKGRKRKNR